MNLRNIITVPHITSHHYNSFVLYFLSLKQYTVCHLPTCHALWCWWKRFLWRILRSGTNMLGIKAILQRLWVVKNLLTTSRRAFTHFLCKYSSDCTGKLISNYAWNKVTCTYSKSLFYCTNLLKILITISWIFLYCLKDLIYS